MANPIIEINVNPNNGSGSLVFNTDNNDPTYSFSYTGLDGNNAKLTVKDRMNMYSNGPFNVFLGRLPGRPTPLDVIIAAQSPNGTVRGDANNSRIKQSVTPRTLSGFTDPNNPESTLPSFNGITMSWGAVPKWQPNDNLYVEIRIPSPVVFPGISPESLTNGAAEQLYTVEHAGFDPREEGKIGITPEMLEQIKSSNFYPQSYQSEGITQTGGTCPYNPELIPHLLILKSQLHTRTINYALTAAQSLFMFQTFTAINNVKTDKLVAASTIINGLNDGNLTKIITDALNLSSISGAYISLKQLRSVFDANITHAGPLVIQGQPGSPVMVNRSVNSINRGEVIAFINDNIGLPTQLEANINTRYFGLIQRTTNFLIYDENLVHNVIVPTQSSEIIVDTEDTTDTLIKDDGDVITPVTPPPPTPPIIPLSSKKEFEPGPDGLIIGTSSVGKEDRKSYSPCNAIFPSIAIRPDDTKHVVWQDDRNGNWEIYYKPDVNTSGLMEDGFTGFYVPSNSGTTLATSNPIITDGTAVEFIPSDTGSYVTSNDSLRIKIGSDIVTDPHAFFDSELVNVQPGDMIKLLAPKKTNDPMVDPLTSSKYTKGVLSSYKIKEVLGPTKLRIDAPIEPDAFSSGLSSITITTDSGSFVQETSPEDAEQFVYFYAIVRSIPSGLESSSLSGIIGDIIDATGEMADIPTGTAKLDIGTTDRAIRLTNDSGNSFKPCAICDSFGNTHVFWHDDRTGRFQIFWKVNNGATWSRDVQLTFSSGIAQNVRADTDSDGVATIVWEDSRNGENTGPYNVYSAKLTAAKIKAIAEGFDDGLFGDQGGSDEYVGSNNGVDKTSEDLDLILISSFIDNRNFTNAKNPDIVIDSLDVAHIVWQQNVGELLNTEIFYGTYDTTESSPTITTLRVTNSDGDSFMPRIAVDQKDNIHVVWHDNRLLGNSRKFEIYYAEKIKDTIVADDTTIETPPSQTIASTNGTVFTVKTGFQSSGQAGKDTQLTKTAFDSMWPALITDKENNIFVFFHSARTADATNDIYGIMFDAENQTWTSSNFGGTDVRITSRTFVSEHATVAIDIAGDVYVGWHDNNDSDGIPTENEIYYTSLHKSSHRSVFQCEELPLMTELMGFSTSGTPDQNTLIIFKKEDGSLGDGPMHNIFQQKCFIIEIETSHPIAYIKNESDAEWSTPIDMQDDLLANGRKRIEHCMSNCNGEKQVIIRFSDGTSVVEERAFKLFLLAPLPIFDVTPFTDESLSAEYIRDDDGIPLVTAGDMYVKIVSSQPLVEPPVIDVLFSGDQSYYNIPTKAVGKSTSEPIPFDAPQEYVGKIVINKANKVTSFDGEASIRIRGKDRAGNIAGSSIALDSSSSANSTNQNESVFPIIFNLESESLGPLNNPSFKVLNRRTSNSASVQQIGDPDLELLGSQTLELSILESNTEIGESITIEYSLAESTPEEISEAEIQFDVVYVNASAFLAEEANLFFTIESSAGTQSIYNIGRETRFRAAHAIDFKVLDSLAIDLTSGSIINRFKVLADYPSKSIKVYVSNPSVNTDPILASTLELDRIADRGIINSLRWTLHSKSTTVPLSVYIDNITINRI